MKEFGSKKVVFDTMTATKTETIFRYKLWYIKLSGVNIYVFWSLQMFQNAGLKIIFTDSAEILFSKIRSAGLNYHLPQLSFSQTITDPYCAEGI